MLDTIYRQEYLRVRVIDNQVILELNVNVVDQVRIIDYHASLVLCEKIAFLALGEH